MLQSNTNKFQWVADTLQSFSKYDTPTTELHVRTVRKQLLSKMGGGYDTKIYLSPPCLFSTVFLWRFHMWEMSMGKRVAVAAREWKDLWIIMAFKHMILALAKWIFTEVTRLFSPDKSTPSKAISSYIFSFLKRNMKTRTHCARDWPKNQVKQQPVVGCTRHACQRMRLQWLLPFH